MWLMTTYEVPLTAVEGVERKDNKHLRRWLGVPPSFNISWAVHQIWETAPFITY